MEMLALLLIVPVFWPIVAKGLWNKEITVGEFLANLGVGIVIVVAGYFGGTYALMSDYEVLNGQLTSKSRQEVACSHSYRCNCVTTYSTDSQGKRTSSETCQTCYEHSYDVDWQLNTTVGKILVSRVESRGIVEPSRWSRAAVGDPVAQLHTYTNYIKGAPASLFSAVAEQQAYSKYEKVLPDYPLTVHDYHYLNRVISLGVPVTEMSVWQQELARRLRELGPLKQVNLVVVFSKESDSTIADAIKVKWLGGKKNDVVVVMGTPEYPKISWVRVISWSDKELFKVQLRDDLLALDVIDRKKFFDTVDADIRATYTRKHMKDFEYLKNEIQPPGWLLACLFIGSILASVGISIYLRDN